MPTKAKSDSQLVALPVDLPFEMPNYKEMDILGIAFRATFLMSQLAATPMDESVPISYDDADMHLRDEVYEKEWEHEPLFPLEVTPKARAVKGRRLSASQSKADHVSTQPSKVAKGHPEAARGLSSKSLATTNPRVTNTTGPGRQASGISVPRSKTNSQTLKASNLSKEAKPPRTVYRPKLSDFPDVIPFELGEIDLLN